MVASIILRAQQMARRAGRNRLEFVLRSVGMYLLSADFVPGMDVGPGLLMPHPYGIVIGNGLRVGANVTFGGGITAGVKQPDAPPEGGFPEICDGATILATAVLPGPVRIGNPAPVGGRKSVVAGRRGAVSVARGGRGFSRKKK